MTSIEMNCALMAARVLERFREIGYIVYLDEDLLTVYPGDGSKLTKKDRTIIDVLHLELKALLRHERALKKK